MCALETVAIAPVRPADDAVARPGRKRVLFITTPWQSPKDNSVYSNYILFPLGIGYLAAIARNRGCEVKVVDSLLLGWKNIREENNSIVRGLTWEEITKEIESFAPDVVAISGTFSSQSPMPHKVAEIVKGQNPKTITLLGGAYASAEPQKAVSDSNIDFVFVGEAERTFDQFLTTEDPTTVKGLLFQKEGKVTSTGEGERIMNLDEIPFPAYDLMHLDKYFKANHEGAITRGKAIDNTVSIITSRGCPHFCNFCSIYQVWGRQWRFRSPKNVVDEIELLVKTHGVKHILFEDDNMTINMTRFEQICDEIVARQLKITWETPNGIRGDRVSLQLAKKMKTAGCKRVRIAIENGDQETLNSIIHKDLNLERALQGIQACLDAKLLVDCFFIFGIPGETMETFRKTHDFALKCLKMGANPLCSMAFPLPGTPMYNECVEKGYLVEEMDWSHVMSARIHPIVRTPEFGPEDVVYWYNKTQRDITLNIVLHPWLFFHTNSGADMLNSPEKARRGLWKLYTGSIKPFFVRFKLSPSQANKPGTSE